MGLGESMKKLIGIEEIEDDEITQEEVDAVKERIDKKSKRAAKERERETVVERRSPAVAPAAKPAERRFSVTNTSSFKLILLEPKSFDECPKLVDSLKGRKPVIINLEKLETDVARKIFDFMSGATYALNGNVQKVANNIFIFAPDNVAIASAQPQEQRTQSGTFFDEDGNAPLITSNNPWK